jgi:hypothetical protein
MWWWLALPPFVLFVIASYHWLTNTCDEVEDSDNVMVILDETLEAENDRLLLENMWLRSQVEGPVLVNRTVLRLGLRRFADRQAGIRRAWEVLVREITATPRRVDEPTRRLVNQAVRLLRGAAIAEDVVWHLLNPTKLLAALEMRADGPLSGVEGGSGLVIGGGHLCGNMCAALACGVARQQLEGMSRRPEQSHVFHMYVETAHWV